MQVKPTLRRRLARCATAVALVLLAACGPAGETGPAGLSATQMTRSLNEAGLTQLSKGDLAAASRIFNQSLKYDPQDSATHFLNALIYDLRAERGERSQFDLAETGYKLALEFDRANWAAAYFLGRLYLRADKYPEAQERFAMAALHKRDQPEIYFGLANAAYQNGDLVTADAAIREARRLSPANRGALRASTLIAAATRDFDAARGFAQRLRESGAPQVVLARLDERVSDWKSHYALLDRQQVAQADVPLPPPPPPPAADSTPSADSSPMPPAPSPPAGASSSSYGGYSSSSTSPGPTFLQAVPKPTDGKVPKMVQVDVVLIRTEETERQGRGVNLLDGLQLQFSGSLRQTETRPGASTTAQDFSRVLTRTISLPAVTYSLNIANDSVDRADVIARPTLVSLDGQAANFFSGEELSIALTGNFAGNLSDKQIGVELAVTPTFIDDKTVLLAVSASRSFINLGSTTPGTFTQTLQTTRQRVNTAVAVEFGQTLILSGLSERQSERTRSGVPLLQDVPLLQNFFARQDMIDVTKSVLILLTPRPVAPTNDGNVQSADDYASFVRELYARFPHVFRGNANIDVLSKALPRNKFMSPFRKSDVEVEELSTTYSGFDRFVGQLRQWLYY